MMAECLYRASLTENRGFVFADTLNARALKACLEAHYVEYGSWDGVRRTVQLTDLGTLAMRLTRPDRRWN